MADEQPIDKEQDYKDAIRRNMRQSIDKHSILKGQMALCYDYFHGSQAKSGFMDLFDVYDVETEKDKLVTPVVYMNLNKIKGKVNVLLGDLIDMGFEASANAVNKEAKSRKQQYKLKVLTDMQIKPMMDAAAAESGINIASELEDGDDVQQTLENYKDLSELSIEACLRYTLEYWNYMLTRLTMLLDASVAGECHGKTSIINGMPRVERLNPLNIYYPRNINDDDFLTKTQAKGHVYYADVREIIESKKLNDEQAEWLKERLKENTGSKSGEFFIEFDNKRYFEPFDTGQARVLVAEWEWVDIEKVAGVQAVYENGVETFEVLTGDEAKKKVDKNRYKDAKEFKVVRKNMNVLKKGTLIGDKYLVEYGDVENQPRYYTDYGHTETSITSYRPYYINGQSMSMVMDIMQTQDFINFIWTKVQLEILKSNGTVIEVDVSKLPNEWGDSQSAINTMFHYMKAHGVRMYNSQQGEMPSGNQGSGVSSGDTGLGATIAGLMSLLSFVDNEMKNISSINDARQGVIQSANQLNGVTQMALQQSAKTSKYFFDNFFRFESKLLTKHAQHIRISWKNNPERWSDIIGDLYLGFIEMEDDIADDDHEVIVKNGSVNRSTLKEYIIAGLQHNLPLHEALELEVQSESDVKGAVFNYIGLMKKKEKEAQAQQAQMQEQQSQMLMARQQEQSQANGQVQEMITNRELQKTKLKGDVELQKTAMNLNGKQP